MGSTNDALTHYTNTPLWAVLNTHTLHKHSTMGSTNDAYTAQTPRLCQLEIHQRPAGQSPPEANQPKSTRGQRPPEANQPKSTRGQPAKIHQRATSQSPQEANHPKPTRGQPAKVHQRPITQNPPEANPPTNRRLPTDKVQGVWICPNPALQSGAWGEPHRHVSPLY